MKKITKKLNLKFLLFYFLAFYMFQLNAQQFTQHDVGSGLTKPQQIDFADIDGDGYIDIVVPEFSGNSISVLYGTGDLSNYTKVTYGSLLFGSYHMNPWAALAIDIDTDGDLDIVFSNYSDLPGSGIYWMENIGNRSFDVIQHLHNLDRCRHISKVNFDADAAFEVLALGDSSSFNNIQVIDVIGGTASVLLNRSTNRRPLHGLFADITNDGALDLILSKFGTGSEIAGSISTSGTHALYGSSYSSEVGIITNSPTTSTGTRKTVVGDFDEDGDDDFISVNAAGNTSSLKYFAWGSGGDVILSTTDGSRTMISLTSGDYDNDGVLDMVVIDNAIDEVLLFENTAVDGVASSTITFNVPTTLSSTIIDPNWVESVDMDGDGDLDLVVSSNNGGGAGSGKITVFENSTITLSSEDFNLEEADVKIYPNPSSSILNVESNDEIKEIKVFNVFGNEILKTTSNNINVAELSQGVYLLEIFGKNNRKVIKRFIKE